MLLTRPEVMLGRRLPRSSERSAVITTCSGVW